MSPTRRFNLRDRGAEIYIELGLGAPSDREAGSRSRSEVDSLLWRGLTARDPEVRRALEAVYRELRGISAPGASHPAYGPDFERSLADDLRFAARSGWLRVVRIQPTRAIVSIASTFTERALATQGLSDPKTWVAIKLFDADGKPAAGASYEVTLETGDVRKGKLDAKGMAKLVNVDGNRCTVVFTPEPEAAA